MTTPERALELAEKLERMMTYEGMSYEDCEVLEEAADTVRHYAEIMQVGPAGLASPIPGSAGGFTMAAFLSADVPEGTQLIIKPAP